MNSKFYSPPKNESPDENIFSKVLSGMKSVFNNAGKAKTKKNSDEHEQPIGNSEDVIDSIADLQTAPNDANESSGTKFGIDSQSTIQKIIKNSLYTTPATFLIENLNNPPNNDISKSSGDEEISPDDAAKIVTTEEGIQISKVAEYTEDTDLSEATETINQEMIKKSDVEEFKMPSLQHKIEDAPSRDDSLSVIDNNKGGTPDESIITELTNVSADALSKDISCNNSKSDQQIIGDSISCESKSQKLKTIPRKKGRKKAKSKIRESNHRDNVEGKESVNDKGIDDELNKLTDKDEVKKVSPVEESLQSKPRIVLTFRSEKTGLRSTNVKIVSDIDKNNDEQIVVPLPISSRRSLRGKMHSTSYEQLSEEHFKRSDNRRKSNISATENDVQSFDTKTSKSANNSESDDSARSPPTVRRNKRKTSSVHSDSNSEESPLGKEKSNIKRSTRCRSKESRENVLANAIARKEKFYNETANCSVPTRLSRRIKPTAKVLANRELRLGFETQNNARLALVSEKPIINEECKITRSRLKKSPDKGKAKSEIFTRRSLTGSKLKKQIKLIDSVYKVKQVSSDDEKTDAVAGQDRKYLTVDEINRCILGTVQVELGNKSSQHHDKSAELSRSHKYSTDELAKQTDEQKEFRRVNRLKKKHLRKLGLRAVCAGGNKRKNTSKEWDHLTDESTMDSTNTEAIVEHLNNRSRSFELRQVTGEEQEETSESLNIVREVPDQQMITVDNKESDNRLPNMKRKISPTGHEKQSSKSSELTKDKKSTTENNKRLLRMTRKRSRMENYNASERDAVVVGNKRTVEEIGSPSKADSGIIPDSQPEGSSSNIMSCLCMTQSNIYLDPNSLNEVEFCKAVDSISGKSVGCGRPAKGDSSLVRSSPRAPFLLACDLHKKRLVMHHCCTGCGLFCTQGIFYSCNLGHLFHRECSLPFISVLIPNSGTVTDNSTPSIMSPASDSRLENNQQAAPPPQSKLSCLDVYNTNPGCPHCGLDSTDFKPANTDCFKVNLEMKSRNAAILLPSPRIEWVSPQMSFRSNSLKLEDNYPITENSAIQGSNLNIDLPVLPSNLLPSLHSNVITLQSNKDGLIDYDELLMRVNCEEKTEVDLYAAICERENTVEKVIAALSSGADPRLPIPEADDGNCLHLSAREWNLPALHIFKTLGCQVDSFDKKQRTPLMLAIIKYDNQVKENTSATDEGGDSSTLKKNEDFYSVLRYMVSAGADITLKGPEGVTALHLAAKNSDVAACSLLLESHTSYAKSFIDQTDDGGWTPLVWAAENGNFHVVKYLLEKGANPMVRDSENNVALHWASVAGCGNSVEALLNFGSHLNVSNVHGDTPLHVSSRQNHYNCVIILLARGAQINLKNVREETALDMANDSSDCFSALSINTHLQSIMSSFARPEKIVSNDLSNGKEINPVQCVNSVDDEDMPKDFTYITENCFTTDINIDRKITSVEACNCTEVCGQSTNDCACSNLSVQCWYNTDGLLVSHFDYDNPPIIFECNEACSCNKLLCPNRGLGRASLKTCLQIYRKQQLTPGITMQRQGWSVKTLRPLARGTLVCEFIGEVLRATAALKRDPQPYLFQLEVNGEVLEDMTDTYCIDAKLYGNVGRFINHKCDPNIVAVRVFVKHQDLRFPRIAFFASRDIESGEEIGFDYGEKFWAIKRKSFSCDCGSSNCRYCHHATSTNIPFQSDDEDFKEEEEDDNYDGLH